MHAPRQVDVKHIDDARLARRVHALNAVQHLGGGEVAAERHAVTRERHVALPVAADVRQLARGGERRVVEGVAAHYQNLALRTGAYTHPLFGST